MIAVIDAVARSSGTDPAQTSPETPVKRREAMKAAALLRGRICPVQDDLSMAFGIRGSNPLSSTSSKAVFRQSETAFSDLVQQ
ncbi:hypothetical protein [Micromonospora sp. NPDC048830]|uniref:hypothetical protein n=1 Tax=Micromonospora sp. NPDC048830 TaxID=3364257 RepID=UPI00371234F3